MPTTTHSDLALVEALLGVHRSVVAGLSSALAPHGINLDQWRVLRRLTDSGHTMGELTKALGIPPASLTRVVDSLATEALAYRRADLADGRLVVIHLSSHGRARLGELNDSVAAYFDAIRDGIGQAMFDQLDATLRATCQAL